MCRIITASELHHCGTEELRALFNKVSKELTKSEPGTKERKAALASLENIQLAMAPVHCRSAPQTAGSVDGNL